MKSNWWSHLVIFDLYDLRWGWWVDWSIIRLFGIIWMREVESPYNSQWKFWLTRLMLQNLTKSCFWTWPSSGIFYKLVLFFDVMFHGLVLHCSSSNTIHLLLPVIVLNIIRHSSKLVKMPFSPSFYNRIQIQSRMQF